MNGSRAEDARGAARNCEAAGLLGEADILYRLAATLEKEEPTGALGSLARVLTAAGSPGEARRLAAEAGDGTRLALLALEDHDFPAARRLLDESRNRDPFDRESASARGRLAFLEKRFAEAVADLLEAALLSPDGVPDSRDARFLRAARALAPDEVPPWRDAAASANRRLREEARRRAGDVEWPDRTAGLVRALVARGGEVRGLLDRARRLSDLPPLSAMGDQALLAAAASGEPRRIPAGGTVYRAGDPAGELFFVLAGGVSLARATPVGPQPMGDARAGDSLGEEALVGAPRTSDARAAAPLTLLGVTADFLLESPARAAWLRHLRACLARRLSRLNALFDDFFPAERPGSSPQERAPGNAVEISPEEKSRSLTSGGLSESDRFLFAAFAEERRYPAESLIFREGDPGDAIYAIARGRVRISRRLAGGEEALAILGPGEIFGDMAVLNPDASGRSADARAHEEAHVLALTRARFESLERADPEGCADLSGLLCRLAGRRCVETAERLARWRLMAGG